MAASLWWDVPETPNKSDPKNKSEDLLVFGYACKLFRDDKKARAIDNGKLLIPWMGDERLMIDRYDGRGHLYDLASHDADSVEDKNPVLTEEEAAIEKACDEERYLELHKDLQEAQLYEEEEWKRYYLSLQEGYQSVGFSYEQSGGFDGLQQIDITEAVKEEDEKPFIVPAELHVPPGMLMPICIKQNARIEKTASFIAQHGIQMEIMLKTKQAGNAQFDFLHFENELNPYYKHVVSMIKSGKYKPQEDEEDSKKEEDHTQDYLHPSLFYTATQLPPPPPPALKPIQLPKVSIHDTPYGALIKSIQMNTESSRLSSISAQVASHAISYDLHTPAADAYSNNPPPPGTEPVTLPRVSSLNGQAFVDQLYSQPPPPGTEDDDNSPFPSKERKKRRRSSSSDSSSSTSSSTSSSRSSQSSGKRSKLPHRRKSITQQGRAEGPSAVQLPPPDVQPIIDRMAMYVAKNGVEFEMVVMSRNDPRFQFLNEYHAYYHFYKQKKDKYLQELGKTGLEADREAQDDKLGNNSQRSVSFSIRSRPRDQESGQPPGKARLFEYDSSEGEDKQEGEITSEVTSGTATPTKVKPQADEESQREIEEKLKDKLASAVKERISQSHKEKQLQVERKRKAAAFLNLIKSSQPSSTPPPPPPEDIPSSYVAEAPSAPIIFEYNNQSRPQLVLTKDKKKSSKEKKKRRRSPTPPSAYSLDKRSPSRPSPPRWTGRPGAWSGLRDRTPPWQRRPQNRAAPIRRSRSPHRRDEKKKKHKRSKSKSPSRKDKNKERSRHSQDKPKLKSKDKEKKKKEKSRHRSKERDTRRSQGKSSNRGVVDDDSVDEFEVSDKSPSDLTKILSDEKPTLRVRNNKWELEPGSARMYDVTSGPSSSTENVLRYSKSFTQSESTDDPQVSFSRPSSQCNSPATHTSSISRGSTPSRSSTETASTDLMVKVRAMLKKSREMILRQGGPSFDDT